MVVDTVEQGQACIEYLRAQNIGRASFMVLEKLTNTRGMEPVQTPEGVPRLFDLIKPKDPRFAAAFYKGVANTLVANDMDQATRIAYGQRRWRVVTLAGQLIDTSGTMSGGGSQSTRGGMSSKLPTEAVRPEVLAQYERESEDAAKELERAVQEAREAEAEYNRLTGLGPTLDMSYEKLGMEIETNKKRITDSERRFKELKYVVCFTLCIGAYAICRSQSKPDAGDMARIAKLDKEIAATQKELEELQEKAGKVEQAISDLEKKILEIGGSKLLTQKSKVEGIKLHINLANDEITKAEVAHAKAEKDVVKYEAAIESNKALLDEADSEITELSGQLEELEKYVTELRAKVEAAQSAVDHEKDDLEGLKAQLDDKEEMIQAFRQREVRSMLLILSTLAHYITTGRDKAGSFRFTERV
jgi:structural maintenance of chromosome 4